MLPSEVKAPIKKGDVIGVATYMIDGKEYTVELIAMQDARKSTFLDILKGVTGEW